MKTLRFLSILSVLAVATLVAAQIFNRQGLNWRTLESGTFSRATKAEMLVIDSENAFQRYWVNYMGQKPEAAPKNIDWNKEKLVAVHAGRRNTGGYKVFVQGVDRKPNGTAHITAVEQSPIPGQFVTQAITSPWTIIKVERTSAEFTIGWKQQEGLGGGITIIDAGGAKGGGKCSCVNCGCNCGCGG